MPNKLTIHSALFLVAILYGANYSIAKIALPQYLEPFGFILLRITATTGLFWLYSFWRLKEPISEKKDFLLLFLCAFFGAGANQMLFFKGLSLTNPINASVIMTMTPIIVLLVAYIMRKEQPNLVNSIGVLLAAAGAYFLVTKDGISLSSGTFLGDILILLNGSSYAIYLVLVKPLMIKYHPITVIKWLFLFGIFCVLPFGFNELIQVEWVVIPTEAWLSISYVIIGSTFTVYLLNAWALQYVNASVIGIYIYLQPVISALIAISFRGDTLEMETILYAVLIMAGVYLVSKN